ncbi:hypothetical protein PR003_g20225 [Phytophthora rubi]|uniref:Secreted protein n=1 Tax=Phytophthora rubi TaxID=129364 RepID=A0A6A3IWR1_9STRA|nr:hypothetical protein PR001_g22906 [Phytophthora rubi]KAE8995716.1 hypothetical protein PR002_g19534 [Phytophthora rubi]KAE9310637.1 hypothetical protein PR003_g20225 [Phytophthora rubi]
MNLGCYCYCILCLIIIHTTIKQKMLTLVCTLVRMHSLWTMSPGHRGGSTTHQTTPKHCCCPCYSQA